MADLDHDPVLQKAILDDVAKKWGVPADEAADIAVQNLVDMANAGDVANAVWYEQQSAILKAMGDEYGFTLEQAAGIASAESAKAPWDPVDKNGDHYGNLTNAESTMRVLGRDKPFDVTQGMIDDYNGFANKKSNPDFDPVSIEPGTYKPSQLSAGFVTGQAPGIPRTQNTSGVLNAVRIAKGESPNAVLTGAKQRSFARNLSDPKNPNYVTGDTWHYVAEGGNHVFTRPNGSSGTLAELREKGGGGTKSGIAPQNILQATPGKANSRQADGSEYPGPPSSHGDYHEGHYPWTVDVAKRATEQYNKENGTTLIPNQVQAVVWVEARPPEPPPDLNHWANQYGEGIVIQGDSS